MSKSTNLQIGKLADRQISIRAPHFVHHASCFTYHVSRITFHVSLFFLCLLLSSCASAIPLLRPNGVAVAVDGSLYVMDRGNYRVVHFDADGRFLEAFGKFGTAPGDIHTGWDIALDSAGNIYICNSVFSAEGDLIHDGIKVFNPSGMFLREIGEQDYDPAQGVTPHKPYGLDIDAQDRVYVADFETSTLRIFDPQGQLLGKFFGEFGVEPGQFSGINDVGVDDQRGLLYVVDNTNSRIQQFVLDFDENGMPSLAYQCSFGGYGDAPGQLAYPQGIAVDASTGWVYVADHANRRVQVFDVVGRARAQFAPSEVHTWQVLLVAVGTEGSVYATDSYNNVIWAFDAAGNVQQRIEVVP
ncbi:MAG: NHL repeat-containing protein [Anaerolineae bacterium]|nr:NHL repeat-containing protein [Anaerolineae bacterium]